MATIKAIEAQTVHQIQSGQVIVDLCSVVKELVENSLDAGATSIDVRFKNQGLDAIEVQDNGSGISRNNYETLALKHYTSKLSTYSDLTSLETFGFRGEALSSLCALSTFTVTTCLAADVPKGSKLEYETSGKLRSTAVVAAQKGTLISVENLFKNLPVRRRELERNIKREWNRVIGVLNQYACIQTELKFSVSQQPTKGKRITLFSTKGNKSTRENIANVFGAKTLTVLIPLDLKLELEPTKAPLHLRSISDADSTTEIHVRGHVSRPAHGEGRQTPDRQMFFVNGRPCGLPQFAKVFNEVYKAYNASQSPFIFADIQLDTHLYDVNVSPDKRTILLHDQPRMLDNLREALVDLFEAQDYAVPSSTLTLNMQTPYKKPSMTRESTVSSIQQYRSQPADDEHAADEQDDSSQAASDAEDDASHTPPHIKGLSSISQWARKTTDGSDGSPAAGEAAQLAPAPAPDIAALNTGMESKTHNPPGDGSPHVSDKGDRESDGAVLSDQELSNVTRSGPQQRHESPIPSIAPPTHEAGVNVSKADPTTKWKRPAPELATITIGDRTVTSMLGGPPKKTKVTSSGSMPTRSKSSKPTAVVPSFQGRLTQMFAASAQRNQTKGGSLSVALRTTQDDDDDDNDDDISEAESEQLFVQDKDDMPSQYAGDEQLSEDEEVVTEDAAMVDQAEDDSDDLVCNLEEDRAKPLEQDGSVQDPEENDGSVDEAGSEYEEDEIMEDADSRTQPSEEVDKRTQTFMKGLTRKHATHNLQHTLRIDETVVQKMMRLSADVTGSDSLSSSSTRGALPSADKIDVEDTKDAEAKLSLTISKTDFLGMKIVGQFNLGFIIAVREAGSTKADKKEGKDSSKTRDDELFIIDQHATDEKYNFERLQASTVVQSQRLVQPKQLDLTALEEEIIKENIPALESNGFQVSIDESGFHPVGQRVQLLSLPLSRETTFDLADLEELVSLLTDHHEITSTTTTTKSSSLSAAGGVKTAPVIPRPSKVRKMFAMRACRSSVMIGKSLSAKQMEKLVRHMAELDKPWNCPHGRPTMRHLCGLKGWDDFGWKEGEYDSGIYGGGGDGEDDDEDRDGGVGGDRRWGDRNGNRRRTDWAAYLRG